MTSIQKEPAPPQELSVRKGRSDADGSDLEEAQLLSSATAGGRWSMGGWLLGRCSMCRDRLGMTFCALLARPSSYLTR